MVKFPKWKGLTEKEITKANRAYKKELKRGLKPTQAQRKARGKATGKGKRAAFGKPQEDIKRFPVSKGWKLYAFKTLIMYERGTVRTGKRKGKKRSNSVVFSVVCADINQIKSNYNTDNLFELHQIFENFAEDYFQNMALIVDKITQPEINIDIDYAPLQVQTGKEFVFQILDTNDDRVFYIRYGNGKIIKSKVWESFNLSYFLETIAGLGDWE